MRLCNRLLVSVLLLPLCSGALSAPTLSFDVFRDRLRGGWAGQMIGVSYGSVYEFTALGHPYTGSMREWKPEYIDNSLQQDDVYVEMTFLKSMVEHGPGVTSHQAGVAFRDSKYRLWHANMAGRENLKRGIFPPMSGHPRYNPHADDIDFQIESDVFGLVSPGMPAEALRLSNVFGRIMNYGDGLYGGQFVSGMYCQAYLEKDATPESIERVVRAGLAVIPAGSDYAAAIRGVLESHRQHPDDWLAAWHALEDRWSQTDLCPDGIGKPFNIDAKLNGAYIVIGLLYGGGDFARTMEITTRCGQDNDCNPSSAAGVLGAILGLKRIPAEYTKGLPALTGRKFEYTDYDYPGLVAACEKVAMMVLRHAGGSVRTEGGERLLVLPERQVVKPNRLEQMRWFKPEDLARWRQDFERRMASGPPPFSGAMSDWSGDWRLVACGRDMDPGVREVLGKPHVLVLHPVSQALPAAIERTVLLPKTAASLVLKLSSCADPSTSDYELRVLVNGKVVHREVVCSPGTWREVNVDLSAYAGERVKLRVENAAGGASMWSFEAMYLLSADVLGA